MSCLREVINGASFNVKQKFNAKLQDFWDDPHIVIWRLNKNFASLIGCKLRAFSSNGANLTEWMQEQKLLDDTNKEYHSICEGLKLWTRIEHILKISRISSEDNYRVLLEEFPQLVNEFWEHGKKSFLNSGTNNGFHETAYLHTLRYYMVDIMQTTFQRHNCGVGIFTLQGFERQNAESKRVYRRSYNNKSNPCCTILNKLLDIFRYS